MSDRPKKINNLYIARIKHSSKPCLFFMDYFGHQLKTENKKGERTTMENGNYNTIRTSDKNFYNIWMAYTFALFNNTFLLFTINMHLRTHLFRLATHTWWIINNYIQSKCSTLGAFNQTKVYNFPFSSSGLLTLLTFFIHKIPNKIRLKYVTYTHILPKTWTIWILVIRLIRSECVWI